MIKGVLIGKVINGKLAIGREPLVSYWDQGLLSGYGLFETMRVYDGRVFSLKAHLQRLLLSCTHLGIETGLILDDLMLLTKDYVVTNKLDNVALRLTLTKGNPHHGIHPTVVIFSRELTYSSQDYQQGFSAVISHVRRNQTSPLVYHKTLNYMENLLALEEARRVGAQEALFLNTNHRLTEGTISNLFFVRDGVVYTPAVTCGLLEGITRRVVIDLATAAGYRVVEGEYTPDDLLSADEAFLTNSLMEAMPLVQVDQNPISHGKPGKVTKDLLERYKVLTLMEESSDF